MNKNVNILALLKQKKSNLILGALFVAAFSFLFLIYSQKNFKVSTEYLIVQNQSGNTDFYTLSKSAEYIGKVLNEAVYSEVFINEVVKSGKVNQEFLPFDKKEKLKQWSNLVRVNRNAELGILSIEVFDNNQKESLAIAQAIVDVITTKNNLFRGEGQNIDIKVLSGPVLEKNPSIMNIAVAMVGGFVLGLLLMMIIIYYQALYKFNSTKFNFDDAGTIVYQSNNEMTKERMEISGIFADEKYEDKLM